MMRAALAMGASLLMLGLPRAGTAQDFRVDLYSKAGIREVVITPGSAMVEICEGRSRASCLRFSGRETARCEAAGAKVRCGVAENVRTFTRASTHSSSVFRLETASASERSDAMRGVVVRAAELGVSQGRLQAVAAMDLETYASGVLAGEAATLKSPSALQAMAILARTWALRSHGRHRADGYDFCLLTHCQFFRPPLAQDKDSTAIAHAIESTSGLILKYKGKPIDAYYSAHCGGRTASAASVWPDRGAPYLPSVSDPYCTRSEQAAWEQTITWADITKVVKQEAPSSLRGPLRDLLIEQKDDSGRVRTLRLVSDSSQAIDANAFRFALNRRFGWNTLKSSLYTLHRVEGGLIFRGRGLGHGVGLCQAGAEQMGQMGISAERILAHYFSGTSVEGAAGGTRPQVLASEHFDLFFPPAEESLVPKALEILEAERRRLGERARVLPTRITVRTYGTTAEFIRATGQPGWVSGSNDGRVIDLQPLGALRSRGLLTATLRHELLHLVTRRLRAPEVPSWYEEGMILYLTGEKIQSRPRWLTTPLAGEDSSLVKSRTEMERTYMEARERVGDLVRRRGANALWQVLEHPTPEDLKWFEARQ
jgi:stage II sporulation protein D